MKTNSILNSFEPVSLTELGNVTLLDRVDSKYIFNREQLPVFLGWLNGNYRVLEINTNRSITYNTVYFDTPRFSLYREHHCGKGNRLKVRFRNYAENDLTFFELKFKTNKNRTVKCRIRYPQVEKSIRGNSREFLETQTRWLATDMRAALTIQYKRTTLVHRSSAERITLDTDIRFENEFGAFNISHLALAELKQEKSRSSLFTTLMKTNNIREGFMSKYCFGMACLVPGLRGNNFKQVISKFSPTSLCR